MLPHQNSTVPKLYNNTTINIDLKENTNVIEIKCPKLGAGDVLHNTNSDFCKLTNMVNYNWQNFSPICLNWLSIHRSETLLAYVINPSYTTSLLKNTEPDPSEQVLRLLNYDNRLLGYCKGKFQSPVSDLSFSYNCPSQKENLIALIDRGSNINVFSYNNSDNTSLNGNKSKYEINLLLEIKANSFQIYETVALNWCPYVGSEEDEDTEENDSDPGMKLAIASDKSIEVLSVDKLIACNSEFKRLELDHEEHEYSTYFDQTTSSIIKIFLSSDGNAVCSASKDNSIKFFQFESSDLRQMHSWEPAVKDFNDKISFFHFLDDYNKLLENYQHEFWGFAFVGTENGEISIWNLRQWKSSQRIKIECDNINNASNFKYKADVTSHIITAINGEAVFIIQISFDSLSNLDKTPKITKITRFQQYNQILSFVCRRSSDRELDIFWLTPKSLERCTIQTDKLIDENSEHQSNPLFNLSNQQEQLTPQIIKANSKTNAENVVLSNGSKTNSETVDNDEESAPINTIFKYFNNKFNSFSSSTSATNQQVTQPPPSLTKITSLDQIEKPNTPTSQEVENLFNSKVQQKINHLKQDIDLNKIGLPQLNKSDNSNFYSFSSKNAQKGSEENLSTTNLSTFSTLDASTLGINKDKYNLLNSKLNELIELTTELKKNQEEMNSEKKLSDCRLDMVEAKLISEISTNRVTVQESIKQVHKEFDSIRKEKDANELKYMNKVTEQFLKKLTDQLNQTISKGLEDFMTQIKSEMHDLNQQVNKIKIQLDTKLDQNSKKNDKFTKQLDSVMNKLKEVTDQQQTFSNDLTISLNHLRQLPSISPSPHKQLNNSLSSVSFSSIYSKEDEERQIKEKIWALIRTQDSSKILEAVNLALNLKDEHVLTKILQQFVDKHTYFINIIKKDQTILISLLNQLTVHQLDKEIWKIKFLPDIITSLDMNSSIVKHNLPLFVNKLIEKLRAIEKLDSVSKQDTNLPLILFVLNQCKMNL